MIDRLPDYVVAGDGDSTLLFLHGLGGDRTNWSPQIEEFWTDFRCVAWTLPGYGVSPPMASLTWPNLSAMVVRVLDEVGVEQVSIVGLSMGGYIAQQFAADHDDRVDKLVLAGTSAQFGRGNAAFIERFLAARLAPLDEGGSPADFAADVVTALLSDNAKPAAVANAVASMSRISAPAYRSALECLVTWNFTDYLDEIEAPTLCIAAQDDKTAPVAALAQLADGIADAQLEVIPDCKHLMNLDRPDAFNALLRDFVQ